MPQALLGQLWPLPGATPSQGRAHPPDSAQGHLCSRPLVVASWGRLRIGVSIPSLDRRSGLTEQPTAPPGPASSLAGMSSGLTGCDLYWAPSVTPAPPTTAL